MSGSSSSGSAGGGIGFAGLLTIVFIVLKILHKVDWPWIWVLSPLWIGLAFAALLIGGMFAVATVVVLLRERRPRERGRYR